MKFQKLKRILCCFMAALILCCAVVRPLEVQASGYGFLGFAAENVIASIVRALGVYVAEDVEDLIEDGLAGFDQLVDFVTVRMNQEYLILTEVGKRFIKTVLKDGLYYVDRNLVDEICNILSNPVLDSQNHIYSPVGYNFDFSTTHYMHFHNDYLNAIRSSFADASRFDEFRYCYVIEWDYSDVVVSPVFIFTSAPQAVSLSAANGNLTFSSNAPYLILGKQNKTTNYGGDPYVIYNSGGVLTTTIGPCNGEYTRTNYTAAAKVHGGSGGTFDALKSQSVSPNIANVWSDSSVIITDDDSGENYTALPLTIPSTTSEAATSSRSDIQAGTKAEAESITIPDTETDVETETGFWSTCISWLKILYNALIDILNAIKTLASSIVSPIVEAIFSIGTIVTDIWTAVRSIGQTIIDAIIAALKAVFVPAAGYMDAKVALLKAKFPFFNSIVNTSLQLKSFLTSFGSAPPVIYIDLSSASGTWYWGSETIFVDMRWYSQYKPTMDIVISAFLWLWFAWRFMLALPGIIQGFSGYIPQRNEPTETGLSVASSWYDRR